MTINWTIVIPSVLVILGWFIANWLAARRELQSKKREVRVGYMIEAYRKIASAANRGPSTSDIQKTDIGSAVEDIQLLGNVEQLAELNKMIHFGKADFTSILEALRRELREELDLDPISDPLKFYRMERGEPLHLQGPGDKKPLGL